MKLGLLVNPIAGMGGRVGLKGTDGRDTLAEARRLGATPVSPERTESALHAMMPLPADVELMTFPGAMGADEARACGIAPTVIGALDSEETTARDTKRAARQLREAGVDLLLFAGGDGTARDIYDAIDGAVPALGIPTGVKLHSSVFAIDPDTAGRLAREYLDDPNSIGLDDREVMDIDEVAFREDRLSPQLYGYLRVPVEPGRIQHPKSGGETAASAEAIGAGVADDMVSGRLYLIGPGTTTRAVLDELRLESTLLGVDAVLDGRLVGQDLNEDGLLTLLRDYPASEAEIIVTVVGG